MCTLTRDTISKITAMNEAKKAPNTMDPTFPTMKKYCIFCYFLFAPSFLLNALTYKAAFPQFYIDFLLKHQGRQYQAGKTN